MISKIAYGIAERGGFRSDPLTNWLAAEREVEATLGAGSAGPGFGAACGPIVTA